MVSTKLLALHGAALALLSFGLVGTSAHAADGKGLAGTIKIDGSSTVFPISEAVAEEFQKAEKDIKVTVGISGTGGGFQKFCRGDIHISDASRPISATEIEACQKAGIE